MNIFREQCNGIVTIDGTLRSVPILEAWTNASAVYWVAPEFPVASMTFKVGLPDKSGYAAPIDMFYHPVRGMWRVYVPGLRFTQRCQTHYKIEAVDEYGSRTVLAEGILRVNSGLIYDPDDIPAIDPKENCFAKFPDGSWRKVTVSEDEVGSPIFCVSDVGIDPSYFESEPPQPYAYNKQTGFFFKVSGFIDDAGVAMLSVGESVEPSGTETFAQDETTRFYYRIETKTDEAGVNTLVVGDLKT